MDPAERNRLHRKITSETGFCLPVVMVEDLIKIIGTHVLKENGYKDQDIARHLKKVLDSTPQFG